MNFILQVVILKQTLFLLSNQTLCGSEFWWKSTQVSLLWHITCHSPGLIVYISESWSLSDQYFHNPPLSLCATFLYMECVWGFPIVATKLDVCHQPRFSLSSLAIETATYMAGVQLNLFSQGKHVLVTRTQIEK